MKKKIGIIVGRFQIPTLTKGHVYFFEEVIKEFDDVYVFIGETKNSERTSHDPLPYEARKYMISEQFPNMSSNIFKIIDIGDYPKWVEALDRKIDSLVELENIPEDSEIYICGSRDSIVELYKSNGGKHKTCWIQDLKHKYSNETYSGTEKREQIIRDYDPKWTIDFREFLVWWYGKRG